MAAAPHHRRVDDGERVDEVAVVRGDDREVRRAIHGRLPARRQPFPRSSDQFDRAFHAPMKTRKSLLYIWRNFNPYEGSEVVNRIFGIPSQGLNSAKVADTLIGTSR